MTLNDLETALLTVTSNVGHFEVFQKTDQYIVWAEDGQFGAFHADDKMTDQGLTGTIDYYTKVENDPNFEAIQTAINNLGIGWRLNSIQYEDDTKYIHYEWVFEVVLPIG